MIGLPLIGAGDRQEQHDDGDGSPDPPPPLISYDVPISDSIDAVTDWDTFRFNADINTEIEINAQGVGIGDLRLQVRDSSGDPEAAPIIHETCEGSAGTGCLVTANVVPSIPGFYTLFISERDANETGNYQISLICVVGPCDSDGDGRPEPTTSELPRRIQSPKKREPPGHEGTRAR